jgi:hypothetical protein
MGGILEATHPLEYVAFVKVKVKTHLGFIYLYTAVDALTNKAFQIGVEKDDDPQTILKGVYMLTENEAFANLNVEGFTLVFEDNEELKEQIEVIIRLVNGKVIFNKTYNQYLSNPLLLDISKMFNGMGN